MEGGGRLETRTKGWMEGGKKIEGVEEDRKKGRGIVGREVARKGGGEGRKKRRNNEGG